MARPRLSTLTARFALVACASASAATVASPLRVAVAANFRAAFGTVSAAFEEPIEATYGSSGLLYAQITQGRPFDLFLSADRLRPLKLVEQGRAEGAVVYARGILVLLVNKGTPGPSWLTARKRIALANPGTAPYGRAAQEALGKLDAEPRRVTALNVAQAFHFAVSGATDGAFVALAQVKAQAIAEQRYWVVPVGLYAPIEQMAVVIRGGREAAARAWLDALLSDDTQALIGAAGYQTSAVHREPAEASNQ